MHHAPNARILQYWLQLFTTTAYFQIHLQVRGLTDNNALNYRTENDKERLSTPEKLIAAKNLFDRDNDRDADESDRERDIRTDRRNDDKTLDYNKELKERDRENSSSTTATHADHSSNKRRRKNSSNCDNSLISTYNANVQERHYSQDSQVRVMH